MLQSRLHATPRCCSRQPRGQKGHCRRRAFLKHRGVCGEERGQDLSDFVVPSPDEGADLVRGTAALKCSQCWACGLRDLEGKEEGAAEVMQGVRREGICVCVQIRIRSKYKTCLADKDDSMPPDLEELCF